MFRLLFLLIIAAAVGGYFTKPDRGAHERAAQAALQQARDAAAAAFDIGGVLNLTAANLAQEGKYEDLYIVSKYTLDFQGHEVMQCWGAYEQVRCIPSPALASATTTTATTTTSAQ
ncbi:MAG: hypothetical protein ABUL55_00350 [Pseudomonadota bacterium]